LQPYEGGVLTRAIGQSLWGECEQQIWASYLPGYRLKL